MHTILGENVMKPHLARLSFSKLKLLHLYIERESNSSPQRVSTTPVQRTNNTQESTASSNGTAKVSSPTVTTTSSS